MAERVAPPHFDVEDSKVALGLGTYISMQVKESQSDFKSFITLHFEKLEKDAEKRGKDIEELKKFAWWIKPIFALIVTNYATGVIDLLMSSRWYRYR